MFSTTPQSNFQINLIGYLSFQMWVITVLVYLRAVNLKDSDCPIYEIFGGHWSIHLGSNIAKVQTNGIYPSGFKPSKSSEVRTMKQCPRILWYSQLRSYNSSFLYHECESLAASRCYIMKLDKPKTFRWSLLWSWASDQICTRWLQCMHLCIWTDGHREDFHNGEISLIDLALWLIYLTDIAIKQAHRKYELYNPSHSSFENCRKENQTVQVLFPVQWRHCLSKH